MIDNHDGEKSRRYRAAIHLVQNPLLLCILLLLTHPITVKPFCTSSLTHKRNHSVTVRDKLSLHEHLPRDNDEDEDEDSSSNSSSGFGLYVHIPYCRRRCNYCDFAIVPIGSASGDDDDDKNSSSDRTRKNAGFENMDANYKKAVLNEINAIAKWDTSDTSGTSTPSIGSIGTDKIRLRSIYFGGGTPSLAPLSTLKDIMRALLQGDNAPFYLDLDDGNNNNDEKSTTTTATNEITIEMDPGTFDLSYLLGIKQMGFNRISLGVQSFDDALLATMGRVHRAADVYRSIDMIKQVFGTEEANYSIDLISGVPGLTLAKWTETLYQVGKLRPRPRHLSLYDLQVEKGTTFGKWYKDHDVTTEDDVVINNVPPKNSDSTSSSSSSHHHRRRPTLPTAEDCAFMYSYASGYLRSRGYEHYEISSYALKTSNDNDNDSINGRPMSHRSKHNQIYWQYDGQWYAIGLGATSNVNGVRFARPRALSDYISWTEGLVLQQLNDTDPSIPGQVGGAGDDDGDVIKNAPPWRSKDTNANDDDYLTEEEETNDNLLDIVMTRLRTSEGLNLDWIADHEKYGEKHVDAILRGFELALELELGAREEVEATTTATTTTSTPRGKYGCIRLNDPKGFLFSNNIISNIFLELEDMDS